LPWWKRHGHFDLRQRVDAARLEVLVGPVEAGVVHLLGLDLVDDLRAGLHHLVVAAALQHAREQVGARAHSLRISVVGVILWALRRQHEVGERREGVPSADMGGSWLSGPVDGSPGFVG
jgi:hypothetical protein